MTVLDFVKSKAKFHSDMTYNLPKKSFIMDPCQCTVAGIYIIMHNFNILKVGKAEGKYGLQGRLSSYTHDLTKRVNDKSVQLFERVMMGPLKDKTLQVYTYQVPAQKIMIEGYELQSHYARSLEYILSKQAMDEGHFMLLSGQH
jgi:hypothetical protein